jgi:hypothetical protein
MGIFKKHIKKKSWNDIKLYQLQELDTLPTYEDELDLVINQLSILLDEDPSYIENMPISELLEEFKQWSFLKELPEEKNNLLIKVDGKQYGLIDFNKMTLGQMVDIEEYVTDGLMKNMHKILSVLYLPVSSYNYITKKIVLESYEPDKDRQEMFLTLTMDIIYPQLLFFYHIVKVYIRNLADSLKGKTPTQEMMTRIMNQVEELSVIQKHKQMIK